MIDEIICLEELVNVCKVRSVQLEAKSSATSLELSDSTRRETGNTARLCVEFEVNFLPHCSYIKLLMRIE